MAEEMDPALKAKIIKSRSMNPVDQMRRRARALVAVFDAIDPLTVQERINLLEEVLEVLDPQGEEP